MATQYVMGEDGARAPEGAALVHTLWGEPANQTAPAYTLGADGEVARPAGFGVAYEEVPEPPPPYIDADGVIRVAPTEPPLSEPESLPAEPVVGSSPPQVDRS